MHAKSIVKFIALGFAGSLALASTSTFAQSKITLSSGAPGGSWYGVSAGLAKLLTDNGVPTTAEQGQGNSNVINVSAKRVETAFAFATALHHAKRGTGVFKKPVGGTRALATLFEQAQHTLVTVDSGIKSFAALKGKRFASHTKASSARLVFLDILKVHGLAGMEDDLKVVVRGGPSVGSKAVKDRQAVGMHGAWYPPGGRAAADFPVLPFPSCARLPGRPGANQLRVQRDANSVR